MNAVMSGTPGTVPAAEERRAHVGARRLFYVGMSGALLVIVLMGFSRSLYFRPFFNVAAIPASVWTHGLVLTAWFVAVFLQAILVARRRVDLHRQFGWMVAGTGVAVLLVSTAVTVNFLSRRQALGTDVEARLATFSLIVWGDIAALVAFALFFGTAVALRHRPEVHKRLMLLSSLSILEPAMFRIWGWPIFGGVDRHLASLGALLALLLALGVYDVASRRKVHAATLLGGVFLIGTRVVALFAMADSETGRSLLRRLF